MFFFKSFCNTSNLLEINTEIFIDEMMRLALKLVYWMGERPIKQDRMAYVDYC